MLPSIASIVSTDDAEIADISRKFGADVPFMRPPELAKSDTPSLPVVQHAIGFAEQEKGSNYDWILLLQPTSPLRTEDDIIGALDLSAKSGTTAVVSITSANSSHPSKLKLIEEGILRPFQDDGFQARSAPGSRATMSTRRMEQFTSLAVTC